MQNTVRNKFDLRYIQCIFACFEFDREVCVCLICEHKWALIRHASLCVQFPLYHNSIYIMFNSWKIVESACNGHRKISYWMRDDCIRTHARKIDNLTREFRPVILIMKISISIFKLDKSQSEQCLVVNFCKSLLILSQVWY